MSMDGFKRKMRFILGCGCLLALAFGNSLNAFAQDYTEIKAGYYDFDKILPETRNPAMSVPGTFEDGVEWTDASGLNALLLSYDTDGAQHKRDIYINLYHENDGKVSKVWDIQDFGAADCKMTFVTNSLQVIDLDNDGMKEVSFMYQSECSNSDTSITKLMLMHKGEKLAIRGKFSHTHLTEFERNIDPSVAKQPAIFKNFMLMNWNEFKKVGEYEYTKSIRYRTSKFILLEKEYMLAAGGTNYQLLDMNGLPMACPTGMKEKIEQAVSLDVMPDGETLLYASLLGVGTYDPVTKTEYSFMTFLPETEAISVVAWSPDKTKIAFTTLNQTQYPQHTKINVITLDGNRMVKKDKYDAALLYMAASDWVVQAPEFRNDHTIVYVERKVGEDGQDEGPVKQIQLK